MKHKELIEAFEQGAKIEWFDEAEMKWYDVLIPSWFHSINYRIKPQPQPQLETKMNKPHKHADLIKAWANGAKIQVLIISSGEWADANPSWNPDFCYRVKPEPVVKKAYMHYNHISKVVTGPFDASIITQHLFESNCGMSDHLEFTFVDGELVSVNINKRG
jgi:hypothetical protein